MKSSTIVSISSMTSLTYAASNASLVRLPSDLLYLLPQPFNGDISFGWLNSTTLGNTSLNHLLEQANQARFISYSDEFTSIIGPDPKWYTIDSPPGAPYAAFEGGAWIPDTDEVWFTYSGFEYPYNQSVTSFDLGNKSARQLTTNPPIRYPYGMYYWTYDGLVYTTEINTPSDPATLIAIDPKTMEVTPIFNSYQGIPLAPCDDVVVTRVNNKDYIFVTTFSVHSNIPAVPKQKFDTAVWRFSLSDKTLLPVIGPNEQLAPNGIRVSPDGRKLYVTNTPLIGQGIFAEQADQTNKANSIYRYDIDDDGFPKNGRLFGLVRTGIANGIHVDNKGRIWTAENDGINVRSPQGVLLGSFNYIPFHPVDEPFVANFALAGNRLVIGVSSFVLVYELGEDLVTVGNSLTN
nr:hypothetical protein CFP56_09507 [Quercus suber]